MILLVGGEKGGAGKTTIAVNLAAMRPRQERDVLLVDTDLRGSASYWTQVRDEASISPRVASIPIQASQSDLWTIDRMDGPVEQARGFNEKFSVKVLLSRGPTNPTMNDTREAADPRANAEIEALFAEVYA